MAALITTADLTEYGVSIDNPIRAERLIRVASAEVIDAAGSPILQTRSVVELPAAPGRILRLPGLPIREIHSVSGDGRPVTGWRRILAGLHRDDGWRSCGADMVTVDYTHGMPEVPEDIKDLVARMVIAALLAAADGPEGLALNNGQLSSIAIDDYKEAYATGADVEAVTEMTLPERTREKLAKRFGAGPTVRGQQ